MEPDADEYKYYSPEVGGVVLEIGVQIGERVELIEIKSDTETGQKRNRQGRSLKNYKLK